MGYKTGVIYSLSTRLTCFGKVELPRSIEYFLTRIKNLYLNWPHRKFMNEEILKLYGDKI